MTPVLCSWLLPTSSTITAGTEPVWTGRLTTAYASQLASWIYSWRLVVGGGAAALVVAILSLSAAGRSFLPEFNEGALTISAVTVPGTSLADAHALGTALERLLLSVPEVQSTARRTGRAELDEHVQGVESAEIDVRIALADRSKDEVLAEIRAKATLLPGTNVTVGQPISHRIDHMLSGTRANVAVKIFGDDSGALRALAGAVQAQVATAPGVVDLATEMQTEIPTLRVTVDPERAASFGLQTGVVAEALQTARVGRVVGQVFEGQVAFPLSVRYPHDEGAGLDAVSVLNIDAPGGRQVPLEAVAMQRRRSRPAQRGRRHPTAAGCQRAMPPGSRQ